MRQIVCQFSTGSQTLIMPEVRLRVDAATGAATVEDALTRKLIGGAVRASVTERRNKRLIYTMYAWRLDGLSKAESWGSYVDFRLKVESDGRAFIETTNVHVVRPQTARGRCS